jgi:hypothetical protein
MIVKNKGIIILLILETLSLYIKYLESARIRAIFINSEGCIVRGPKINHLCAPYTVLPNNKTKSKPMIIIE